MSDENTPPSMLERLTRAVANTQGGGVDSDSVTGVAAGLSGDDQIRIALEEIEQQGGSATIQQIYNAVSRQIGQSLSEPGRSSLRSFVNKVAVERGYVYPYDTESPGWRITPEGRQWLASSGEDEDATDEAAHEDTSFADDDTPGIATREEWQARIQADERIAWLVTAYPQWLAETFGDQVAFDPLENQRFRVLSKGQLIQRGRFNQTDGLYVWFPRTPAFDELQQRLSKPSSLKASRRSGSSGYRFIVYTEDDYRLLQEITEDMIHQPMTMADAAYTILSRAGGGPLHLTDILKQAQEQGLIETSGQTPQLSLASALLRDGRFNNLGKNMWLLTASTDEDEEADVVAAADYTPQIYAGSDVSFWRIHFPYDLWKEAFDHGVIAIGFPEQPQNQSVQRFESIHPGDRIVVYVQKGRIGGIGVVTRAAYDTQTDQHTTPPASFDTDYPRRIDVTWSDYLDQPANVLTNLQQRMHSKLYNRLRNPHTVMPLPRDDYLTILSLLGIDDIPDPSGGDGTSLLDLDLRSYASFVQELGDQAYSAAALLDHAQETLAGLDADTDADSFATVLRQLRLLTSDGTGTYQAQPYVVGDDTALLRLMALAYLHPASSDAETYTLPARTIVPRLRDPAMTSDTFAPALGPASPHLLAWYAEAGQVSVEGTNWQPLPDALVPLEGDDPATTMYNRFLAALLAELDGTLADLSPVPIDHALPAISELETRLRELDTELIIDAQLVKRICRSLLAGRHVVLSGPPGTGKTELARRLPALLWREDAQTFTRLMTNLNAPPVQEETEQRHGYAVELVTATEDWGVRDVVGGIGPRLDGTSGGLRYTIEHGHLTRTVLRHFASTESGRKLPPAASEPKRRDYRNTSGRYRGIWLVIDEFTRAPIDAAFGSLLTTLSGGEYATLAVPTGGIERPIRLPRDFRIIGTLNSFDRHFLNEMSEALKRRFDFIDVLPPHPAYEAYEQGIAVKQALRRLHATGLVLIHSEGEPERYEWDGVVRVQPNDADGRIRYTWHSDDPAAQAALESFWYIFRAIRVFRQLGTAQAVAVYGNLFTGRVLAMSWAEALDTALADTLADQLQVLTRDEQRTLDAYIEHAGNADTFHEAVDAIMQDLPLGRRATFLYALRQTDRQRHDTSEIDLDRAAVPPLAQLQRVFALGQPLQLPTASAFRSRLRDLIGERGL